MWKPSNIVLSVLIVNELFQIIVIKYLGEVVELMAHGVDAEGVLLVTQVRLQLVLRGAAVL